ncbi:MAG: Uncharacterized protein G01um101418_324 [Parcubacteria group bacterium Gr01-1014_18]|nr:MAG: Uncharacterized protein Greene041636_300 [Parcubacteria group bacterium Greene0416_36]TSC81184.1 MAG: Uncharacterized protein G01um101418_324 [Parcubacteria group bacterium Gr01-1014_18]TSC99181.1 MAG: Uncharacterized protein Greene101420_326 [Parcubacteria group bacterium Greene1014_20]TSD07461.1 MAG: Uncharacterized protein Greene07142_160 [Parcubacteria group bacterium Greene0714_2]
MALLSPLFVLAEEKKGFQKASGELLETTTSSGMTEGSQVTSQGGRSQTIIDITSRFGEVIQFFIMLIGTVTVIFIIYGGFQWVTAGGDSGKVDAAKQTVTNACIGLAIVTFAYIIIAVAIQLSSGGK